MSLALSNFIFMIRSANPKDASTICDIYNYYIASSHCTFETELVPVQEMRKRITTVLKKHPWLVLELGGEVLGYAYATSWKTRKAYDRTVESTVYIRFDAFGKGYGNMLYEALIKKLKDNHIHAVLGGIALPNEGSIALHEKLGFQNVGQLKQVGYKFDRWIDVGYWELILK